MCKPDYYLIPDHNLFIFLCRTDGDEALFSSLMDLKLITDGSDYPSQRELENYWYSVQFQNKNYNQLIIDL